MKWYRVMACRDGEKFIVGYWQAANSHDAVTLAQKDYSLSAAGRECGDVRSYEWKAVLW